MKKAIGIFLLLLSSSILAKPIEIVAAENFYGDVAKQIGGPYVTVTSIISNPNQDPHLFSSSPSTAKTIADADLIVYNGIGYDAWINTLLQPDKDLHKQFIVVAKLLNKQSGDNPHIWYGPSTMPTYADALVEKLNQLDPNHQTYYQQQLSLFKQQNDKLLNEIRQIKQQYKGTPVIATEPVFNDMADALGLVMYGKNFQLSIMNETEPSAADILDFQDKLNKHLVKALIYNGQVTSPMTEGMKDLAKKTGIPTVGVSETQPISQNYLSWMTQELNALEAALAKKTT